MQFHLFDAAPISRQSDKATSHAAASDIEPKLSGLRAEFVRRLAALGEPATAQEIADGNESLRKRARECERIGIVRSVGTRRCRVTGKIATVYRVVR